jgi:hypothetical protein
MFLNVFLLCQTSASVIDGRFWHFAPSHRPDLLSQRPDFVIQSLDFVIQSSVLESSRSASDTWHWLLVDWHLPRLTFWVLPAISTCIGAKLPAILSNAKEFLVVCFLPLLLPVADFSARALRLALSAVHLPALHFPSQTSQHEHSVLHFSSKASCHKLLSTITPSCTFRQRLLVTNFSARLLRLALFVS